MKTLIIVATFLACGLAAPVENIKETFQISDLSRPSPINPDIPSDPKPEDKVTLISESEEEPPRDAKAIPTLLGPYVLPSESLSRARRAHKDSSESDEDSSEEKKNQKLHPLAAKSSTTPVPSTTVSRSSGGTVSGESTSSASIDYRKPYSPQIHQHNEHLIKPTTEIEAHSTSTQTAVVASSAHINDKRDIPVPLTRKYNHNDDDKAKKSSEEPATAEVPKEEVKQEEKKNEDHNMEQTPHPATIQHPIPVAELFAKKPHPTK